MPPADVLRLRYSELHWEGNHVLQGVSDSGKSITARSAYSRIGLSGAQFRCVTRPLYQAMQLATSFGFWIDHPQKPEEVKVLAINSYKKHSILVT